MVSTHFHADCSPHCPRPVVPIRDAALVVHADGSIAARFRCRHCNRLQLNAVTGAAASLLVTGGIDVVAIARPVEQRPQVLVPLTAAEVDATIIELDAIDTVDDLACW